MKNKWFNVVNIFIGTIGIWIFLDHILTFTPHYYFYRANPGIDYYVGVNVVGRMADLSFFTYHTLILFSCWCILLGIGSLLDLKKVKDFCTHRGVVAFITTNYAITCVLYMIFELIGGHPTFGLYALNNRALHNFGTNIVAHYVLFFYHIFLITNLNISKTITKKHYLYMIAYLACYYLYVKISGLFMYDIVWYPYPIFDCRSLFGLTANVAPIYDVIFLIAALVVISTGYYLLLRLTDRLLERVGKKQGVRLQ